MNENYREEVLKPFFKNVKSGESFYLLGAPSVGKTRLMDFMMGDDPDIRRENPTLDRNWIREKYLGKETAAGTRSAANAARAADFLVLAGPVQPLLATPLGQLLDLVRREGACAAKLDYRLGD